jgi:type II secretion system protein N
MKQKLLAAAKWAAYPAFYFFCLAMFGYLTFPYDRLKDRIIAEYALSQSTKARGSAPNRVEVDEVSSYWFSGLEMYGMRLIIPADEPTSFAAAGKSEDAKAPTDTVIEVEEAHARVRILPLLIGRVKVDFWAKAFGGEVSGAVPVGGASGPVELELEDVDLGQVQVLTAMVGLPLKGVANGQLELTATDGKFNKANGTFELTVKDVSVGDGVTKIKGAVALPEAKLGELTITAEAKDGVLKITNFAAPGPDIELVGDGKIAVREPWNDSNADLYLRFKFSDGYRSKNDVTKSLLGSPGSNAPALFELADPKIKRAKRPDGFYGWHMHGPLKRLKFDPTTSDGPGKRSGRQTETMTPPKKPGGLSFPLGTAGPSPMAIPPAPPAAAPPAPEPTPEPREAPPPPAVAPPPPPPPVAAPPPPRDEPAEEPPTPERDEPAE